MIVERINELTALIECSYTKINGHFAERNQSGRNIKVC